MQRTVLALAIASALFGQIAPKRPTFEVASVKENTTGTVSDQAPRRSGDGLKMKPGTRENKIVVDGNLFPEGTGRLYVAKNGVAHFIGKGSSLEQLVTLLSWRTRAPVRARTGLTGAFDYDVQFVLNESRADASSAPLATTAIQQDLGLKLEKEQGRGRGSGRRPRGETDAELTRLR